jgi:phytoene dehydrogenase-like protein
MKAIIIGSGMAGLTAALTLARAGHQVEIFEQSQKPGGVTQGFADKGYRWDLGQLNVEGFGKNEPCGQILSDLGVLGKIGLIPEDREYIFPDFGIRVPEVYAGLKWRLDLLKKLFPEEKAGLDRYWRDYVRFTRLVTLGGRLENGGLPAKLAFYSALLPLFSKLKWTADRLMAHYFRSEKLKAVFISILADFFTPPSQFMGLGVFSLNAEIAYEKRMPEMLAKNAKMIRLYSIKGGTEVLVNAFRDEIIANGGKIITGCAVKKVLIENGHATGVVDEKGLTHPCDRVIASGGAKELFFNLVGKENLTADFAEKVANIPLMDSVFMLHLGVDFDPSQYLRSACTYFYGSYDIEGEVARARQGLYHEGAAGFVVHFPTLRSPQMAPKGRHALTIYTICPEKLKTGEWEKGKEQYADKLLEYVEKRLPGLREHIVVKRILIPPDFRRIAHLEHHAFGGVAPIMNAWKVPHQTPIEGLWFIGAQSESGGGVNNVIPSAYKVAQRIIHTS